MSQSESKLGFNGAWSMAVGGMVGGGIFSTLGVVVAIAGGWAWFSFAVGGLIALAAGYSYVKLASYYGEGGWCVHFSPGDQRRGVRREPFLGAHRGIRSYKCSLRFHFRTVSRARS